MDFDFSLLDEGQKHPHRPKQQRNRVLSRTLRADFFGKVNLRSSSPTSSPWMKLRCAATLCGDEPGPKVVLETHSKTGGNKEK
jgi:hypothetical protein